MNALNLVFLTAGFITLQAWLTGAMEDAPSSPISASEPPPGWEPAPRPSTAEEPITADFSRLAATQGQQFAPASASDPHAFGGHAPAASLPSVLWQSPWYRVQRDASSSQGSQRPLYEIPQFEHPSPGGIIWGPFKVGLPGFELRPYPLRIPVFQHLYEGGPFYHVDIERLLGPRSDQSAWGTVFYPEPQRLVEIQYNLLHKLLSLNWQPKNVEIVTPEGGVSVTPLFELTWLWPPTEVATGRVGGLTIPHTILRQRLRRIFETRAPHHLQPQPNMYRLDVTNPEGSIRRILMVPVKSQQHVTSKGLPRLSDLWLFYQGVFHRRSRKVAFLGAMYLPSWARYALHDSNGIAPAFVDQWTPPAVILLGLPGRRPP